MSQVLRLEPRLTHDAAVRLWDGIREQVEGPIALDASEVRHVSGQALQVLLAAQRLAAQSERSFELVAPSQALQDKLRLLGASFLLDGDAA